jgi:hypothetical protein
MLQHELVAHCSPCYPAAHYTQIRMWLMYSSIVLVVSFSHQEIQSFKITLFTFVDPWPGEETIWRNVELQLVWLCVLSISQLAQTSKTESYQNPP